MEQYTAWMADLRSSRKYELSDRNEIQNYIAQVCDVLNAVFAPSLTRSVGFSAGDGLQGLFQSASAAYCYMRLFRMLLRPVKVRVGLGVGSWDIRLRAYETNAQDGQAYHRARSAIKAADGRGDDPVLFCAERENDQLVNFAFDTETILTQSMRTNQVDLMLLAELLYPICIPGTMDLNMLLQLAQLAQRRDEYNYFSVYEFYVYNAQNERRAVFSDLKEMPKVKEPVNPLRSEHTLYIGAGKTRGMAAAVADCTGIARQSVVRTMHTANIYNARNAAIVAIRLLEKEGWQ